MWYVLPKTSHKSSCPSLLKCHAYRFSLTQNRVLFFYIEHKSWENQNGVYILSVYRIEEGQPLQNQNVPVFSKFIVIKNLALIGRAISAGPNLKSIYVF